MDAQQLIILVNTWVLKVQVLVRVQCTHLGVSVVAGPYTLHVKQTFNLALITLYLFHRCSALAYFQCYKFTTRV